MSLRPSRSWIIAVTRAAAGCRGEVSAASDGDPAALAASDATFAASDAAFAEPASAGASSPRRDD
jgi:hypothetical protein